MRRSDGELPSLGAAMPGSSGDPAEPLQRATCHTSRLAEWRLGRAKGPSRVEGRPMGRRRGGVCSGGHDLSPSSRYGSLSVGAGGRRTQTVARNPLGGPRYTGEFRRCRMEVSRRELIAGSLAVLASGVARPGRFGLGAAAEPQVGGSTAALRFPGDPGPGRLYYGASVMGSLSLPALEQKLGGILTVRSTLR